MKTTKMLLLVASCFFTITISAQDTTHKKDTTHKHQKEKVQYTCPMHPDVVSKKPGKCPKCGMELASKKEQMKKEVMKQYTCPMHPDVVSDKPGNCSKCGMALTEKKKEEHTDHQH